MDNTVKDNESETIVPDHTRRTLQTLRVDEALFASGRISELLAGAKDVSIGVGAYREVLSKEAKTQELAGNTDAADTLQVLFIVVDMSLQSGDLKHPFHACSWIGNARSPIPEDFTEEQIAQLELASKHLSDPLIVSRISDVAWVKLRKVDFARKAITSYLQAAQDSRLMEMARFWCLERAFRLTVQINSKEHYPECEKIFGKFREDPALYDRLSIDLLLLAQSFTIIEPKTLAEEARKLSESAITDDPFKAKELSLIASTLFTKLGDREAANACHRVVSDGFLTIAKQMDALNSTSFIEEAIEALRRGGGSKFEVGELNKLLTEKGQESIGQMKQVVSEKIDFTDTVQAARKLVEGLKPFDALVKLAFQFPVLSYDEFKAEVEKSIKDHPLIYLISAKHISKGGRQYSRRPSFMSEDAEEQKEAFDTEVAASMAVRIEAIARFCLMPALRDIYWTSRDLGTLFNTVAHRPIVPPDRAQIFFAGIQAGLEGNFLEAAHILIPQIENSLRFLLEARGLVVTSLDSENLHSEMSLNKLFDNYRSEIAEIFGCSDLAYMMESFLCRKTGQNFRNELSHGLLSQPNDYRFAFAWWLSIHLLFLLKFPENAEELV